VLGDSVTTDHISPAGSFSKDTPAGKYLLEKGVKPEDFNQYGARRGNYEIMTRGTFANNRIRNLLVSREGGFTVHYPDKAEMSVFDAAMQYKKENIPLIVIAGDQYGTGSSRDWAAKGPLLLGVKAIVAAGYERIHRSNLIGMGVLPLQFSNSENFASLDIDPSAKMNVTIDSLEPRSKGTLTFYTKSGKTKSTAELTLRVDTPMEKEYILSGGVLPNVLDKLVSEGR
jgi:aconitate hydratase